MAIKMPEVNGVKIDGRTLPSFTWNADLIAFDGPLLSLYKSEYGTDAFFAWLDCDDRRHRWGILDVDRDTLRSYLSQACSLLDVFMSSTSVTVFDSWPSARKSNMKRTTWNQLPDHYLPESDSYFAVEIATPEARQLAEELSSEYSIKLAGELYLEDLAGIPKLYQQLYSFHYGLEHLSRAAVRTTITNLIGKWKGGFSAVNLFTGLKNVTPSIHRARLENLHYASPGHITMELLPAMASRIKQVADALGNDDAYAKAEELYRDIYRYFRSNEIAGFEDERNSKESKLTPAQTKDLKKFVDTFLELLGWQAYRDSFIALDIGPLSQLRALLAYYRRLRRLLSYANSGLIELT